ncbi:hypothetical protein B9Z65_4865 [Elsinoe australis]|uniref:Uncharacterized protein n=1 Tax=Elsinoe australis TaxID=40998 RepID=A0A2P8A698_9PEZI|nr:hypothetical protein B9Z65_4865 [Elsinoe australis]
MSTSNSVPFVAIRQLPGVPDRPGLPPRPFWIRNLIGHIATASSQDYGPQPTWMLLFRTLEDTPQGEHTRVAVHNIMAPVRHYGVDFPPPLHVNREDKNVYLRIYNGNSRIACGSFMVDARGIEKFYFGVARIRPYRHRPQETLASNLFGNYKEIYLDRWFVATGIEEDESRSSFVDHVFHEVDRRETWQGLRSTDFRGDDIPHFSRQEEC